MIGQTFGGYRIESLIGRGGMGVVYRAEQLTLGRPVALKVIAPEFSANADFRARFARESRMAASIDHPNVVPVYEADEIDGTAFLAMRLIDGVDLRTMIATQGSLRPDRAATIIEQIGSALDAAHARGLVHRDVKPANILITGGLEAPHAYLTDFGLTKDTGSHSGLTATGHWIGTLDYVAPEQVEGRSVDARTDVYSLGCVLYEALTGQVPYPRDADMAKLYAHAHEPPPRVSDAAPGLPRAFDGVVERALAKDPADRYPSAGDVGRAARAAVVSERVTEPERSVAAGAAAPPGPPSRGATRLDPAPPPVAAPPPAQTPPAPPGWTPVTEQVPAGGSGRGGIAIALVVAAILLAGAAIAVALITTGGSDESTTSTPEVDTENERKTKRSQTPTEPRARSVSRFSTPRDSDKPYRAAYCDTRAERLYCWTPNDGFTIEMADGVVRRAGPSEENVNKGHAPAAYKVVPFGESRRIGTYTCTSRPGTEGLTCSDSSGNGWQMPRYEGCPRPFGPSNDENADLCNRG